MSLFGQVWLWSLVAFVLGVLLTWLLLVRPAHARVRTLERQLVESRSEPVAASADYTASARYAAPAGSGGAAATAGPAAQYDAAQYDYEPSAGQATADELDVFERADEADEQYAAEDEIAPRQPEEAATGLFEPANTDDVEDLPPTEGRTRVDLAPAAEADAGVEISSTLKPEAPESAGPERAEQEQSRGLFQPALPSTTQSQSAPEHDPARANSVPEEERAGFEQLSTEPDNDDVAGEALLPKRQRKESPRGGFDPPEPIQPSMREMTRREPVRNDRHSGSLFEPSMPTDPEPDVAQDTAPEPQSTPDEAPSDAPVGPFGSGSAMPLPGGGKPSEEFAVKASVTTLRYCPPESAKFSEMVAEVWFRTPQEAERVGFRPIG